MFSSRHELEDKDDRPRLSRQAKSFLFSVSDISFFGANMDDYVRRKMRKLMNNSDEYKAIFEKKRKADVSPLTIYDNSKDDDSDEEMPDEKIQKGYAPTRQKLGK